MLQSMRVPRILVLDEMTTRPPSCVDVLEDWIRPPVIRRDLQIRAETLRARMVRSAAPTLDEDGVVHFGGSTQPLSPSEARLMTVLVPAYNAVVSRDDLVACGWPSGEAPGRNALDLHVLRLRRRLASLGLSIQTAWRRGYMLVPKDDLEASTQLGVPGVTE